VPDFWRSGSLIVVGDPNPNDVHLMVAGGALVLIVAALAVRLGTRTGLPSLLLYLALGLAVGESGLGFEFSDVDLTQTIGLLLLALVLTEGGMTTQWATMRPALAPALVLASAGVAISVVVVGCGSHYLLGLEWRTSLLLGAVISSTDAAAVFSVLRSLPLRGRLGSIVESESALNDPPVVILVTLLASDAWESATPWSTAGQIVYQLAAGAVIGLVVGRAGQWLLEHAALPAAGLYPLATLALGMLAYSAGVLTSSSGFVACYLAGLWLGNASLPHQRSTIAFSESAALLAQMGLFVMLGLLASPSRLPAALLPALVVGFVLTFVARPLSVALTMLPFDLRWREQAFLSWAGLRGAVPIVLTTIPATTGVAGAHKIFDVIFVLVVVYTLVQAPTLPLAARRLGVAADADVQELDVESAHLDDARADLLQVTVTPGSRLSGVYVDELRLPEGAHVTLVLRGDDAVVPSTSTCLRTGDRMLIITDRDARLAAEERLRAVSRSGRLAGWHEDRRGDDR
jgi:cell volume regulation protein A